MKHTSLFLLSCILTFSTNALTSTSQTLLKSDFCLNPLLNQQPILSEGRVLPLFTHTHRVRSTLFPKQTCPILSTTALFCSLSLYGLKATERVCSSPLLLKVEHAQTKKILGLDKNASAISKEEILQKKQNLAIAYQQQKDLGQENGGFAQDLVAVMFRVETLESIEAREDWKVLTDVHTWVGLNTLLRNDLDEERVKSLVFSSIQRLSPIEKRALKLEYLYEKLSPFSVAILISILGFLFSILSIQSQRYTAAAVTALSLVILLEALGITLRIWISGRGPVTNMYETVMWAGLGAFALSAILGFKFKDRRIWAAGFAGNSICLLMMTLATTMLDSSIQPLVPVLRDNFWLSTHVTSITFSYSCFFLSWLIANFVLLRWIFTKKRLRLLKSINQWNHITRIAMQVGVVFLATGVLLGGIWADYSWGRFWGWDPKETWALIALIVYIIILHGKYIGWFKELAFTMMAGIGFLFVLMAWFGVNYILATGLHSYGFSTGGSLFLLTVFILQLMILGSAGILRLKFEKPSVKA